MYDTIIEIVVWGSLIAIPLYWPTKHYIIPAIIWALKKLGLGVLWLVSLRIIDRRAVKRLEQQIVELENKLVDAKRQLEYTHTAKIRKERTGQLKFNFGTETTPNKRKNKNTGPTIDVQHKANGSSYYTRWKIADYVPYKNGKVCVIEEYEFITLDYMEKHKNSDFYFVLNPKHVTKRGRVTIDKPMRVKSYRWADKKSITDKIIVDDPSDMPCKWLGELVYD